VDQLFYALNLYLFDANSLWITLGYILSALLSSIALYDFGPLKGFAPKKSIIFIHYTLLAGFFGITAFLVEALQHGFSLQTLTGFFLLLIKLFIAYFSAMILYKIVKDYLIPFGKKKLNEKIGK